jgi:hypothetical protein
MALLLPTGELRHSQAELWESSKPSYIKRYFENGPNAHSPEMTFGSLIANTLDRNPTHPLVADIPRLRVSELELSATIGGVPFGGRLDTHDRITLEIFDHKTGKKKPSGVVLKKYIRQLIRYTLLVKKNNNGDYHKKPSIIWIPTKNVAEKDEHGVVWEEKIIARAGPVEVIPYTVTQSELDHAEKEIVRIANEISEAYKAWLFKYL